MLFKFVQKYLATQYLPRREKWESNLLKIVVKFMYMYVCKAFNISTQLMIGMHAVSDN